MRSAPDAPAEACGGCLRHAWLVAELSGPLHACARNPERLLATLALGADELVAALAGRRRADLAARLGQMLSPISGGEPRAFSVCAHRPAFPRALRNPARTAQAGCRFDRRAPRVLFADLPPELMRRALEAPLVAIVGSARCSAYGAETARALGRGLAAAGVTVASTSERGIARAAREGACELGGTTIVVESSGLDRVEHRRAAGAHGRTCTITELAPGCAGRAFGPIAAQRLVIALASLVVVVEARASALELNAARVALDWPRPLAAVPGRAGSPTADGPHALLRRGAALVCGAADALALLPARAHMDAPRAGGWSAEGPRDDAARELLARVAEGEDTLDRLLQRGGDAGATLLALSELEVAGLLTRDRDGAYIPAERERESAAAAADALLAGLKPSPGAADDD